MSQSSLFRRSMAVAIFGSIVAACSPNDPANTPEATANAAPAALTGRFTDDYGSRYEISDTLWTQDDYGRYRIVEWDTVGGFLIAQNDTSNGYAPGLWSRIDWVKLDSMPPYDWGFCLSAYDVATREEARATDVVDRSNPRIGCNGYPFTRMRDGD